MEGLVDLDDLPRWFTRLQKVTHPSSKGTQCRLTTLIEASTLHYYTMPPGGQEGCIEMVWKFEYEADTRSLLIE